MLSRVRTDQAARTPRGPRRRSTRARLAAPLAVLAAAALAAGLLPGGTTGTSTVAATAAPARTSASEPVGTTARGAGAADAPQPAAGGGSATSNDGADVVAGTDVPPAPGPGPAVADGPADGPAGEAPAAVTAPAPAGPSGAAVASPAAAPPDPAPAAPTRPQRPGSSAPGAPGVVVGTLGRVWAEELATEDGHAHAHAPVAAAEEDAARLSAWVVTDGPAYPVDARAVADVADGSRVTLELGPPATSGSAHPVLSRLEVADPVMPAGATAYGEGSRDLFGLAAASVVHDVTVVLATPRGAARDSMTVDTLKAAVDGGANGFWGAQSRNQRGFAVRRTHGWQTLTSTCDDPYALWDEVAARVGFTAGPRKHLLVYIPPSAGCGAGLGTVGAGPDSGGLAWVGYSSTSIVAHELGHNMGLGHSNGLLCTDRADGTYASGQWQSGCTTHDYRDYYDVMGVSWASLGSLAAPQADALGVLRSTEKLRTSEPVRVQLVPQSGEGLRVLRVDDPAGAYYVEYRVASGWDAWLADNYRGLDAGVLVHRRHPGLAREVLLLDGSVTSGTRTSDWRSALAPGASLTTASGGTRITVEKQTSEVATVVVHRDGVAPSDVAPPAGGAHVELTSPTWATGPAGTTVFAGVATAPEGTLHWEVLEDGVRKGSGSTMTGANGRFDSFQVPVALPAGTFTVRVWVPDDSDGESTVDPALLVDALTVTLR